MTWRNLGNVVVVAVVSLFTLSVQAATDAAEGPLEFERAYTNLDNRASLQRGAKLFVNYCMGCHSAQYMRYNRLSEDLGLTEPQVEQNLMFTAEKIFEPMEIAMRDVDQVSWFGIEAPDLSLVARARGPDWVYNYLRGFYLDPSRPNGWNNALFVNSAMPNPLWQLQGIRVPVYETRVNELGMEEKVLVDLEFAREGKLSEAEFEQVARDIATFLEYVGEPAKMKREAMGIWVIVFIGFFTFLAWLLKREYWRDVH